MKEYECKEYLPQDAVSVHPDTDWSGYVPQPCRKKRIEDPKLQLTPIDGNGIGPSDFAETEEWTKPARKTIAHKESDAGPGDELFTRHGERKRSLTFNLIGGPVPVNDPMNVGSGCWETEAQIFSRKKATDLRQLTDKGRSMHVRGRKRHISNKDDSPRTTLSSMNKNQTQKDGDGEKEASSGSNFIGFRSNQNFFLKEIGKEIANTTNFTSTNIVITAPFATDENLPTDPYKGASGERKKDLLLENFSSVVPGYTGMRTFID
jgi:hypothetical protein